MANIVCQCSGKRKDRMANWAVLRRRGKYLGGVHPERTGNIWVAIKCMKCGYEWWSMHPYSQVMWAEFVRDRESGHIPSEDSREE